MLPSLLLPPPFDWPASHIIIKHGGAYGGACIILARHLDCLSVLAFFAYIHIFMLLCFIAFIQAHLRV